MGYKGFRDLIVYPVKYFGFNKNGRFIKFKIIGNLQNSQENISRGESVILSYSG